MLPHLYAPRSWHLRLDLGLFAEFSSQETRYEENTRRLEVPLPSFSRLGERLHQILPGGDVKLSRNLVWSFGICIGATSAGNRIVYKSRFEFQFGLR